MSASNDSPSLRPFPSDALAAVLVLYKCNLEESQSYRTLLQAFAFANITVPLVIYDNSPNSQPPGDWLTPNITYHHDPSNGGLVSAYNFALTKSEAIDAKWLLLLDQDTSLPADYLTTFFRALPSANPTCAAFVPRVSISGRISSPKRFILTRPRLPISSNFFGPAHKEIVAINSGMFVSVEQLRSRGGYPLRYRLDAVDFWFCANVYASGRHLKVLDTTINHQLSIRDMCTVSIERWNSITSADSDFTIEARRSRATRVIAACEGVLYAALLVVSGHPRHAKIRLAHACKVLKSVL